MAVRERIAAAIRDHHRRPQSVELLAVSKSQPAADIRAAYVAGQRRFGESYLQEALRKMAELDELAIEWHFIGRVQSNKTRAIAGAFDWVHGIDRLKTAQRLSDQRPEHRPPLNVCLQVNFGGETTKAGIGRHRLTELARAVSVLPRLRLRGLMALPEPATDPAAQRARFREVADAAERLRKAGIAIDTLSMGMSHDLEAAIAEGATMVRIGTAVFGERHDGGTGNLVHRGQ